MRWGSGFSCVPLILCAAVVLTLYLPTCVQTGTHDCAQYGDHLEGFLLKGEGTGICVLKGGKRVVVSTQFVRACGSGAVPSCILHAHVETYVRRLNVRFSLQVGDIGEFLLYVVAPFVPKPTDRTHNGPHNMKHLDAGSVQHSTCGKSRQTCMRGHMGGCVCGP